VIYDASAADSTGDLSVFVELLVEVDPRWLDLWERSRIEYRLQRPGHWTPQAGT
jgi:hypothetical protein